MKAHIKNGELILLPASPTEEWAVNQWLDQSAGTRVMDARLRSIPQDHEDREDFGL